MKNIGVVAKTQSPLAVEGLQSLSAWLVQRGMNCLVDNESAQAAGIKSMLTKSDLAREADMVVVMGGDGTFLSVARMMEGRMAPILGVNLGALGFLTEFAYEEMFPALEQVLSGDYAFEDRIMLDVGISREGKTIASYTALNDIVINRGAHTRMLHLLVYVDGVFVNEYTADGLIVATPTGSTAYNLSAGGPIVHPSVGAIIISPICPHTLSNRPIVIPDGLKVEIALAPSTQGDGLATMDGQVSLQVGFRDRLVVKKASSVSRIILSPYKNYYQLLRGKLKWGETLRHGAI
ncbi:MAG: NAD(+)/NADH kinase [Nitrospinae bacterium]|nr:NAD(+)/NADH kinase [Nitrospinota bacterium]